MKDCQSNAAILPLAHLPKGLVVADVNIGPLPRRAHGPRCPFSALSPLDQSIIEAHRILHASPQEAERRLRAVGATYVVTCEGLDSTTPQGSVPADALQTLLFADKPPAFLAPVTLDATTPLKVWRVKP